MADGGGTSKQPSRTPRGNSPAARRFASAAALWVGLNSGQVQSSRNAAETGDGYRGDTPLTDSSSLGETKKSPLELPQSSYTQARELQEQRERERRMVETADQFVGAPTFPTTEPLSGGSESSTRTFAAQQRTSMQRIAQEAADEEDMTAVAQAQQFEAIQAKDVRQAQVAKQKKLASEESAQRENTKLRRERIKQFLNLFKGSNAVASEDGVNGLVLLATMNAELFNHIVFQNYDILPEPTVPEILLTLTVDLFACIILLVMTALFFTIALAPIIITGSLLFGVQR